MTQEEDRKDNATMVDGKKISGKSENHLSGRGMRSPSVPRARKGGNAPDLDNDEEMRQAALEEKTPCQFQHVLRC